MFSSNNNESTLMPINKTPIQNFYSGSNIFITGGTGFYGKVLLEKLLRACSDINKIYLLVRSKKGLSAEERYDSLFNQKVFDRLRCESSEFRKNIIFVQGDCSQPNLGLSNEDKTLLISNVNIIFHAAATVSFDAKIRSALDINVKGTKYMLDLCKQCLNLKSVVYVSTAYSNCNRKEIEERFYDPPADTDEILKLVENTSDEELEKMTPGIIGRHPNTYAYSKALAEDVVKKNSQDLPLTVFRPSIVIASRKEPFPGWVDNFYGPNGVIAAAGSGVLRTMQADFDLVADIIPVDMVVNASISAAWDAPKKGDTTVLNYVSSCGNPITWGEFFYWNMHFGQLYPTIRSLWYYTFTATKHRSIYFIYSLFMHFIPGLLIDILCIMSNKKPKMVKIYLKINKFCDVLTYFSTQQWKYHDDNVVKMWNKMSIEDQKLFDFNIRGMQWDVYTFDSLKTIRNILIRDSSDTLVPARKRMARLKTLHYTLMHLIMITGLYFLYYTVSQIINSFV